MIECLDNPSKKAPSILDAIEWLSCSWKAIKSSHITSCFIKSGYTCPTVEVQPDAVEVEPEGMLQALLARLSKRSHEPLLRLDDVLDEVEP